MDAFGVGCSKVGACRLSHNTSVLREIIARNRAAAESHSVPALESSSAITDVAAPSQLSSFFAPTAAHLMSEFDAMSTTSSMSGTVADDMEVVIPAWNYPPPPPPPHHQSDLASTPYSIAPLPPSSVCAGAQSAGYATLLRNSTGASLSSDVVVASAIIPPVNPTDASVTSHQCRPCYELGSLLVSSDGHTLRPEAIVDVEAEFDFRATDDALFNLVVPADDQFSADHRAEFASTGELSAPSRSRHRSSRTCSRAAS